MFHKKLINSLEISAGFKSHKKETLEELKLAEHQHFQLQNPQDVGEAVNLFEKLVHLYNEAANFYMPDSKNDKYYRNRAKLCANQLAKHFGKIALSASEEERVEAGKRAAKYFKLSYNLTSINNVKLFLDNESAKTSEILKVKPQVFKKQENVKRSKIIDYQTFFNSNSAHVSNEKQSQQKLIKR